MKVKILSENELIARIVERASEIAEFHDEEHREHWGRFGFHLEFKPRNIHLSSGDKMLIRRITEARLKEVPADWRRF